MATIGSYQNDDTVSVNDKVLATDSLTGKTKNIELSSIVNLINAVAGKDYIQYQFSLIDFTTVGSFTSKDSKTNPEEVTQLFLNKQSLKKDDLTALISRFESLQDVVITLKNQADTNNFVVFKIIEITNNTDYFIFDVVLYKNFYSGTLSPGETYSAYFDIKENFEDKTDKGNFTGTSEDLNTDIQTRVLKAEGKSLVLDNEIEKLVNLDNTKDVDKPISIAQTAAIAAAEARLNAEIISKITNSTAINGVTLTSAIPATGNIHAFVTANGTYVNWNNIVVPTNTLAVLTRVNGVYASSQTTIVVPDAKIKPFINQAYATVETQVSSLGKIWYNNAATAINEIPGTSNKWVEVLTGYVNKDSQKPFDNTFSKESKSFVSYNNNNNNTFKNRAFASAFSFSSIIAKDWSSVKKVTINLKFADALPTNLKYRLYTANKNILTSISEVSTLIEQTISFTPVYAGDGYATLEIILPTEAYNEAGNFLGLYITADKAPTLKVVDNQLLKLDGVILPKMYYGAAYNSTTPTAWAGGDNTLIVNAKIDFNTEIVIVKDNVSDYFALALENSIGKIVDNKQIALNNTADKVLSNVKSTNIENSIFYKRGSDAALSLSGIIFSDWKSVNKISLGLFFNSLAVVDLKYRIYTADRNTKTSIIEKQTVKEGTISYTPVLGIDGYSDLTITLDSEFTNLENDLLGVYISATRAPFIKSTNNSLLQLNGTLFPKLRYGSTYNGLANIAWAADSNNYVFSAKLYSSLDILQFKPFMIENISNAIKAIPLEVSSDLFVLPSTLMAVQNEEINIHRDSVFANYENSCNTVVTGSNITQLNNRVAYKPTSVLANFNLEFREPSNLGVFPNYKSVLVKTIAKTGNNGNKTVLQIGDSLSDGGAVTSWVNTKIKADVALGASDANFIGFRTGANGVRHQGTAGWSFAHYLSKTYTSYRMEVYVASHALTSSDINSIWSDGVNTFRLSTIWLGGLQLSFTAVTANTYMIASGTLTHVSGAVNTGNITFSKSVYVNDNPFYDKDTNDVSLVRYCEKGGFVLPDIISIYLGTNDVGQGTSIMTDIQIDDIVTRAITFINILLDATKGNPNAKILLNLIPYASKTNSKASFRERAMRLNLKLIKQFDNVNFPKVYVNPTSVVIDRKYGYPEFTTANELAGKYYSTGYYESDDVHYNPLGNQQISDQIYCGIKHLML